jgi:hypothetical protein
MMRVLLAICLMVAAAFALAADKPAAAPPATAVTGEVLETMDAAGFTYLRLKTKDAEVWAAVRQAPVKTGAQVTLENVTTMQNFESKTLKKTFPVIYFGNLPGAGAPAGHETAAAHAGMGKAADLGDVRVAKATGANARTVAEIVTTSTKLKDAPVLVRGKIVKYNPEIMGKNWIHLRDGSGSAAANTNDILVTTADQAKVGDVVTVKGVVRADKDFGAGYTYKVLIEDATLQK